MKLSRAFNILGLGDPMHYVSSLLLLVFGMLIITDGQIGIQATPNSEVKWLTIFASLDDLLGWIIIWMAVDGFFNYWITKTILQKIITPILKPILIAIIGQERIDNLAQRLRRAEDEEDTDEANQTP